MAGYNFVEINLSEAKDLADLTGIWHDLVSARSMAKILAKMLDDDNYDFVDPISTAILVRYSRPFTSGVRRWQTGDAVKTLTPEQIKKHDRLRAFRDKHIAHSVNAFEQNQPVARYWDDQVMDEGISSIECNHTRITGLSSADIEDVVELTTVILRYVDSQREKEKARVLEIVRKIPIDEVLVRSHQRTVLPDLHTAGKHRKR